MLHDANQLPRLRHQQPLHCSLLVVGGGVAGLSLCHQLRHSTHKIILLESGGLSHSASHEALNQGYTTIFDAWQQQRHEPDFMRDSRCRRLGGSGHLWGGKCASLDPIDFTTRHWLAHSGWPLDYEDLKPYLDQACELFQIPHFQPYSNQINQQQRPPWVINQERVITTAYRRYTAIAGRADAQRYEQFIQQVCSQANVDCYLNATVTQLHYTASGKHIDSVHCRNNRGESFCVSADQVVLAAGGLENPRLLMHSNRQQQQDLGNHAQHLGRFFMGHVIHRRPNSAGQPLQLQAHAPQQDEWQLYRDKDPQQLQGIFQLSSKAQRRDRLPNTSLTLDGAPAGTKKYSIYLMQEQQPNPLSQLRLSPQNQRQDALAVPQLELDWHFSEQDAQSLMKAFTRFQNEFAKHDVATLSGNIEPMALIQQFECARHHMGSTRMHQDPHHGVVDEHCRVHGCENLYISGASVFPTGGIANPTLAIVALALRLGVHLNTKDNSNIELIN